MVSVSLSDICGRPGCSASFKEQFTAKSAAWQGASAPVFALLLHSWPARSLVAFATGREQIRRQESV